MSFNLYFCPPDAIIFQTYSLLSKIENLNKNIIPILHSVFRLPRVPTRYFPRGFSLSFPLSFPPLHLLQHPSSNNRRSFHSQNTLSQTNFFKSNSRKYFPITKPKPPLPFYLFPPRQQPRPKGRGILRLNNYIDNYLYFYILLVFLCLKSF